MKLYMFMTLNLMNTASNDNEHHRFLRKLATDAHFSSLRIIRGLNTSQECASCVICRCCEQEGGSETSKFAERTKLRGHASLVTGSLPRTIHGRTNNNGHTGCSLDGPPSYTGFLVAGISVIPSEAPERSRGPASGKEPVKPRNRGAKPMATLFLWTYSGIWSLTSLCLSVFLCLPACLPACLSACLSRGYAPSVSPFSRL